MYRKPEYVDWDEANTSHIEAADLTPEEVESVLDAPDGKPIPSRKARGGGDRWRIRGTTPTGKSIAVIFEVLCHDPFFVRPVTAFEVPEQGDVD
jgi:uncharacterized DUF497 family protein